MFKRKYSGKNRDSYKMILWKPKHIFMELLQGPFWFSDCVATYANEGISLIKIVGDGTCLIQPITS